MVRRSHDLPRVVDIYSSARPRCLTAAWSGQDTEIFEGAILVEKRPFALVTLSSRPADNLAAVVDSVRAGIRAAESPKIREKTTREDGCANVFALRWTLVADDFGAVVQARDLKPFTLVRVGKLHQNVLRGNCVCQRGRRSGNLGRQGFARRRRLSHRSGGRRQD